MLTDVLEIRAIVRLPPEQRIGAGRLPAVGYFLPDGYQENPIASRDDTGDFWDPETLNRPDYWQVPVYRYARRIGRGRVVLDVGCGAGRKLMEVVAPVAERVVGLDQGSGIRAAAERYPDQTWITGDLEDPAGWSDVAEVMPDLVICADVVEHVEDPEAFLRRLGGVSPRLLISTPDRSRLPKASPLGPPRNQLHIREWAFAEFRALLESSGFRVDKAQNLPPTGGEPWTTRVHRVARQLRHPRAAKADRSCMLFDCRPVEASLGS